MTVTAAIDLQPVFPLSVAASSPGSTEVEVGEGVPGSKSRDPSALEGDVVTKSVPLEVGAVVASMNGDGAAVSGVVGTAVGAPDGPTVIAGLGSTVLRAAVVGTGVVSAAVVGIGVALTASAQLVKSEHPNVSSATQEARSRSAWFVGSHPASTAITQTSAYKSSQVAGLMLVEARVT